MSNHALRESLEADVMTSTWGAVSDVLAPHVERETLFLVDASLALLDVAVALATDDAKAVGGWLQANELTKLTATALGELPTEAEMECVIVQPFVLARPLP